jgi:ABC-type dipeptide/oligopeptide/nickel transport system permease subunit
VPLPTEPGGDVAVGERRRPPRGHVELSTVVQRVGHWLGPRIVPALLAVTFAFALPYLAPEGLRGAFLGSHADEPAAQVRVDRDEHLPEWAPERYVRFVAGVVHGDFGRSYVQNVDVERELARHALLTAALVVVALVLTRNRYGPSVVFAVLAVEAALGWPGLGRVLATAIDLRDVVVVRAVLAVVLLGCVALPRVRRGPAGRNRTPRVVVNIAWVWLFVVALSVAFAQRLPLLDPDALRVSHAAPSLSHWLGTDDVGRDVLARLVWGAQGTLLLAVAATVAGAVIGLIMGALGAEARATRVSVAWIGAAGIPAVGVSVGLASVLSRDQFVLWQWLVPVALGPVLAWALVMFDRSNDERPALWSALAALGFAAANVVAAEAVLGALGGVAPGALTWGSVINDVRTADHRAVWELLAVTVVIVATVASLRTVATSLARTPGRAPVPDAGTMA